MLKSSTMMMDTRQQDSIQRNHRNPARAKSQVDDNEGSLSTSREIEGHYASIPITNGVHISQYDAPHLLSQLHNSNNSTFVDRKKARALQNGPPKMNHPSHKMSKDSGYYSCEFLDHSNNSSPLSDNKSTAGCRDPGSVSHYREPDLRSTSSRPGFRSHLPPSDSGVFTLSRSYSRPSRLAQTACEGIYDNVL